MKKILSLCCFFFWFQSNGQSPTDLFYAGRNISKNSIKNKIDKRWFSTAEIEYGVSNEVQYSYSVYDNRGDLMGGRTGNLDNKASFGVLYSINYPLFNKLTLGAIGGFQHHIQQQISALKFGGIIRYHFINYESVNLNLMTAYNMALSDNIGSDMTNVRLGLQFPIARLDDFNLNLNVFWDYNSYMAHKIIINKDLETPGNITFKSYGISLGLLF